jgi:endonuclease YncB( thermonuclease family)
MRGREFSRRRPRGKRLTILAAFATAWLLVSLSVAPRAEAQWACAELEAGPSRTVTRIVDGETLVLDDGTELRLIGMLAPRAIDVGTVPGIWRMEQAAVEALQALVSGRTIEIHFAGEPSDRYGRLKGHAFLASEEGTVWVQGRLLEMGLARAYAPAAHRACEAELLAAERTAREARLGVWAEAAYEVRSAEPPAALLRHVATFQLVEGRVMRVATTRGRIYLNFGQSRGRGFSVSLRLGDRARLGRFQDHPKGLEQAQVRVRGWIEERTGQPVVDLTAAGSVEVIAKADGPEPDAKTGRGGERRSRPK